jgi:hypothetical protein
LLRANFTVVSVLDLGQNHSRKTQQHTSLVVECWWG